MSMNNPYAPPVAAVRDIPMSYASTELADLGSRLGAAFLDGIIFAAMVYLPMLFATILAGVGSAAAGANESTAAGMMMLLGVGLMLVGLVAWIWLTVKYVNANGQSIAKKIVGIKVVRSDGSPISFGRLFWLRNVVNTIIGVIPLYGLLDVLFIFSDSRQCLHDKLADTIVVKA
jgi:uncharacterized RDD family membrane protein YckC